MYAWVNMKLVLRTTHLFPHSFSFLHRKVSKMTNPCFHFLVSFTFTSKPKFLGTHIKFHQIKLHSVKWINLQAEKTPPQSVTTQGFWRLHTLGKKVSEKSHILSSCSSDKNLWILLLHPCCRNLFCYEEFMWFSAKPSPRISAEEIQKLKWQI